MRILDKSDICCTIIGGESEQSFLVVSHKVLPCAASVALDGYFGFKKVNKEDFSIVWSAVESDSSCIYGSYIKVYIRDRNARLPMILLSFYFGERPGGAAFIRYEYSRPVQFSGFSLYGLSESFYQFLYSDLMTRADVLAEYTMGGRRGFWSTAYSGIKAGALYLLDGVVCLAVGMLSAAAYCAGSVLSAVDFVLSSVVDLVWSDRVRNIPVVGRIGKISDYFLYAISGATYVLMGPEKQEAADQFYHSWQQYNVTDSPALLGEVTAERLALGPETSRVRA